MGLGEFYAEQKGEDPTEAFTKAVDAAREFHGDEGHTGSIAEKSDFVVIEDSIRLVQEKLTSKIKHFANVERNSRGEERQYAKEERIVLRQERSTFTTRPKRSGHDKALAIAYALIAIEDERIASADKPAGAIQYVKNHWLFFGMAEE